MIEYLYIHIPFCIKKCLYCDFISVSYDDSVANEYINALCAELELRSGNAGSLRTVFIGGGTPTTLDASLFVRMIGCIREHFSVNADAEITVEANPGTIDRTKIGILADLGVNRISLGVQSFIASELGTLQRIHSAEQAIESAGMVREAGIDNLSIDLIYGIPGQTFESWSHSLAKAIALGPRHISAYELTPEQGTPLMNKLENGQLFLPNEDTILRMQEHAASALAVAGYEQYEISNYALQGYRCIHNMNYWNRGEYIGAGAAAHSFVGGMRTANTSDISEYIRSLDDQIIPVAESVYISDRESLKEFIFLGLRKIEGISLSEARNLGIDISKIAAELDREGLTEITADSLRLTGRGKQLANTVIVRLLEKLGL